MFATSICLCMIVGVILMMQLKSLCDEYVHVVNHSSIDTNNHIVHVDVKYVILIC